MYIGIIIHYDPNHNRRNKNAGLMMQAAHGFDVVSVGTLIDVASPGFNTLIQKRKYGAVFLNSVGVEGLRDPLETAILRWMENGATGSPPIVLMGDRSSLDGFVHEYAIRVIETSPNGYLEKRHIPEIEAAIKELNA